MTARVIGLVGLIQAVTTAVLISLVYSAGGAISVAFGSSLAFLNFILLVYLWKQIFKSSKKRVALPVFLIVIKYAILIFAFIQISKGRLYFINFNRPLDGFDFALGVLTNPIAVIVAGFSHKWLRKRG